MSVGGKRGVSIPVVMVHEGEGHVKPEMKNGYLYRGVMEASE